MADELSPDDDARLAAWRATAEDEEPSGDFAGLRAALDAARSGDFDEDPPPRIDALLMAAAKQHAPQPRRSWWQRLASWMQPIAAHPALAGAAALVLVAGTAGVLYRRGDHGVATPAPPAPPAERAASSAPPIQDPAGAAAAPVAPAKPGTPPTPPSEEAAESTAAPPAGAHQTAAPTDERPTVRRPSPTTASKGAGPAGGGGASTGGDPGGGVARGGPAPAPDTADDSAAMGGKKLEATAPPPPPPPAPPPVAGDQDQDVPADKPAVAEAQPAAPPLAELLRRALAAARAGDCVAVRKVSAQVLARDPAYHRDVFARERTIAACLPTAVIGY